MAIERCVSFFSRIIGILLCVFLLTSAASAEAAGYLGRTQPSKNANENAVGNVPARFVLSENDGPARAEPSGVSVSSGTDGWPKEWLIDEDVRTVWSSVGHNDHLATSEWASVQLAERTEVDRIRVYPRVNAGGTTDGFPKDFVIGYAFNGIWRDRELTCDPADPRFADVANWVPVLNYSGFPQPTDGWIPFEFGEFRDVECLRILGTQLTQDGYGNRYLQLAEIEIYAGEEKIEPKEVSASSETNGWPKMRLIDGDTGSVWSSVGHNDHLATSEWASVQLAERTEVDRIRIYPRVNAGGTTDGFPKDFVIGYAFNGIWRDRELTCDPADPRFADVANWVPVLNYSGFPQPTDGWIPFEFGEFRDIECLRILGTQLTQDGYGNRYLQLAEIEIYAGEEKIEPKDVSASSETDGWPKVRLIDDDRGSVWSSIGHNDHLATSEWAAVLLAERTEVGGIRIYPRANAGGTTDGFPKDFVIGYAFNGIWRDRELTCDPADPRFADVANWVPVLNYSGFEQPLDRWIAFVFDDPRNAQCMRILGTQLTQDGYGTRYLQLGEIEVLAPYEARRELLIERSRASFVDDPMRDIETELDKESFDVINALDCPRILNNPMGWSAVIRTGGRPFLNFDHISVNGTQLSEAALRCDPGDSGLPQAEIDAHYAAGKSVNRIWLTHSAGENRYPIVLVTTPDGFFNVAGAQAPLLQGAAVRVGLIGKPFDAEDDYLQHIDALDIREIDENTIRILANVHSQAGEGVFEIMAVWDAELLRPVLNYRLAIVPRSGLSVNELGFAGFNFMRGPTLFGLLSRNPLPDPSQGGIEAFHDGRTIYLVDAEGNVTTERLVPPLQSGTIDYSTISTDVGPGAQLILDQSQNIEGYFSKFPNPAYEHRTDLVLELIASSAMGLKVNRAQTAVDLSDTNPEANETVNTYFAASMPLGDVSDFEFRLAPDAQAYDEKYAAHSGGVVFVSDRFGGAPRLYMLQLNDLLEPLGTPIPLTDGVITDPHYPSASADGRTIVFEADDYNVSANQRIYSLDLSNSAVRRLTVDPFSTASSDGRPSMDGGGNRFAAITNRHGLPTQLIIQNMADGLNAGFGNEVAKASSADWCHSGGQLVYADAGGLYRLDLATQESELLVADSSPAADFFQPKAYDDCEKVIYLVGSDLWISELNGQSIVAADVNHADWIDSNHLIVEKTIDDNTDLFVLMISSGQMTRLTTNQAADYEPTFVPPLVFNGRR